MLTLRNAATKTLPLWRRRTMRSLVCAVMGVRFLMARVRTF